MSSSEEEVLVRLIKETCEGVRNVEVRARRRSILIRFNGNDCHVRGSLDVKLLVELFNPAVMDVSMGVSQVGSLYHELVLIAVSFPSEEVLRAHCS